MADYTQRRPLPDPMDCTLWTWPTGSSSRPVKSHLTDQCNQYQVTTSWRTGSKNTHARGFIPINSEDSLVANLETSSNYGAYFKSLKDDSNSNESKVSAWDNGHTFSTEKHYGHWPIVDQTWSTGGASPETNRYRGLIGHTFVTSNLVSSGRWAEIPAFADLGFYGPKAIRNTLPTSPHAGLAQALEELRREGLPDPAILTVLRERTKRALDAGGQYLNVQFGWKPLIKDTKSSIDAVKKASSILDKYQRESGKLIHRKFTFPQETTYSERNYSGILASLYGVSNSSKTSSGGSEVNLFSETGVTKCTESLTTIRRIWFSGAYTYHLQGEGSVVDNLHRHAQLAGKLFGTEVTPSTLWALQPWSWLADWYGNMGDNIANASALTSDGLVLKYGYLMVYTKYIHDYTFTGPVMRGNPDTRNTWKWSYVTERKERFRASPYGFGSNPASFTDRQWAILGALGFTKAFKILH